MVDTSDTWSDFCSNIVTRLQLKADPRSIQVFLQGFPVNSTDELSQDDRLTIAA